MADQLSMFAPKKPTGPTLYVTNWSSVRLHGPGRRLSIMARPRTWEHGDGLVSALAPRVDELEALQQERTFSITGTGVAFVRNMPQGLESLP